MSKHLEQHQEQLLYITIRDDVADWIIEHGLSKTESKLFFYFLKLDRFGDRPAKVKVAEILLATGIGKTAYHAAIAKFEALGWFDFRHTDVTISNQASLSSSEKRTQKPEFRTEKPGFRTEKANRKTGIPNNKSPEPLAGNDSTAPHTIQTYTDFIQTLSQAEKESFLEFGKKKASQLPKPPELPLKWIESHFEELRSQWEKSRGKMSTNQSQKWENHPQREEWLDKIRELGPLGFRAEDMPNEKLRAEFVKWAEANNLIWGADS